MLRESLDGTAIADQLTKQLAVIPRSVQECIMCDKPSHVSVVNAVSQAGKRISGLIRVEKGQPLGVDHSLPRRGLGSQPLARVAIAAEARVDRGRQGGRRYD